MDSMNVRSETRRLVDIPLAGTTLRVVRIPGNGTEPGTLLLAHGFGEGDAFRRPAWSESPPVQVPDSVIPDLVRALQALEEVEP